MEIMLETLKRVCEQNGYELDYTGEAIARWAYAYGLVEGARRTMLVVKQEEAVK